ncbi:hypothetical protein K9N50_01710 [bacterium]|nr:hypothetical protein [bacterium]
MSSASERVFAAKSARHKRLAKLPIHEKVRILIQMQKVAAPILKKRGKEVRVWKIYEIMKIE